MAYQSLFAHGVPAFVKATTVFFYPFLWDVKRPVTSAKRVDDLPQTPTVAESGFRGFDTVTWFGLLGPAKLPAAVVAGANAELNKALNSPDLRKKLEDQGLSITPTTPSEFGQLIQSDITKWAPVVKGSGATVD